MTSPPVNAILLPGAWMGAWIWEPTVERLQARGVAAETLTLPGLETGLADAAIAAVRLDDHVRHVSERVSALAAPVVLVSHSYSGMVAALVADRLSDRVAGAIHIAGYLPLDGRSLLDGWGSSEDEREHERDEIAHAGNLWLAPERPMLDFETDLTDRDRDFLAARFTPHPDSTVTDAARLASPVSAQPSTYVALSTRGDQEAWREAPAAARAAEKWRKRALPSGHWPMLSLPDQTADLLATEIEHHPTAHGHDPRRSS